MAQLLPGGTTLPTCYTTGSLYDSCITKMPTSSGSDEPSAIQQGSMSEMFENRSCNSKWCMDISQAATVCGLLCDASQYGSDNLVDIYFYFHHYFCDKHVFIDNTNLTNYKLNDDDDND